MSSDLSEEQLVADASREDESVVAFWERAHRGRHGFWLSGYPGAEIWQRLDVAQRIRPGAVVLNIGVGLGYCTRALAEAGCVTHALDISQTALDGVRDVATVWRADQLERLPRRTFDVALSHLVAQHMSDADLSAQIAAVLRALKPFGIFALQFSSHVDPGSIRLHEAPADQKVGGVLRTPVQMRQMVRNAGGVTHRMIERERWPAGAAWWVAQVRRPRWRIW